MNILWTKLIDIAMQIGKWLVKRIAKWAISHVVGYMYGKIDDFKRRLARAKTERRQRWLTGRIARWTKAARWISSRAYSNLEKAAKEVCKLPELKRLPLVAKCERLVAA